MEEKCFDKLYKSFSENFNDSQDDIEHFEPLFMKIANELKCLNICSAFVDVSRKKNLIDFNLNLENGLFLSVASNVGELTDDVMFSLALNHKTLVIDVMNLKDVVERTIEVMRQIKCNVDGKKEC